jgi:hypothetical protein
MAILSFHLWADDKCASNNCTLDADSVVLVYRLDIKPYSFYKFSITNNAIKICNYVKVRKRHHTNLFKDITTSQDLNDVDTYRIDNNLTLSPTEFNEIKQSLFNDLNALYINKTEDVILSRTRILKALQNHRKYKSIEFYYSEDIFTHKLSIEVYKNNNCETSTAIITGSFFNNNWEVRNYPKNGQPDEYYVEYSPLFVDLYNLINSLTEQIPPPK